MLSPSSDHKNSSYSCPGESSKLLDDGSTSSLASRLVAEAMSWVNTPFEHQGRIKGVGVDCVHFVDIVAANIGMPAVEIPNNYNPKEDGVLLLKLLDEHLEYVPTEERKAGDIIAFIDTDLRGKNKPSHLAFIVDVTPVTTYIVEAGRRGVVRHRLDGHWFSRVHSCWRIPENLDERI